MSELLIFGCSHGSEDPERAILPFVAANTAAIAGQEAVVLLTIDGVWLGTKERHRRRVRWRASPNSRRSSRVRRERRRGVALRHLRASRAASPRSSSRRARRSRARRTSWST